MLNLVCYVSLCEGLRAGAGSLSYIVHVDCCGLSTIVIKKIIMIIIIVSDTFFNNFADILERVATYANLLIVGDVNIHLDDATDDQVLSSTCRT